MPAGAPFEDIGRRAAELHRGLAGHRLEVGDAADTVGAEQFSHASPIVADSCSAMRADRMASATRTTSRIGPTSWTRTTRAPYATASATAAAVPGIRAAMSRPV